jgi:hypothetical protein
LSTVLLVLDESGGDGTTSFDDKSSNNHTITANGNFQWDTAQAPTGQTSSGLSDGTGDYLQVGAHADFGFSSGDFTVECFVRFDVVTGTQVLVDMRSTAGPLLYLDAGTLNYFDGSVIGVAGTPPSADTWAHVAISRSSGSTKMFVDGTQTGSTYSDSTNYGATTAVRISESKDGGSGLIGWICSVRIANTALYTANFTPPSLPLQGSGTGTEPLSGTASTSAQTAPSVNFSVPL